MLEKLNYHLKRIGVLLSMAALIAGMAGCPGGYNPPPSENLEIRTWYDLDAIRDNLEGNHTLMNDLNSTTAGYEELAGPTANGGKGWYPIGIFSEGGVMRFTGSLDGQGHQICDMFINRPFPEAPDNGLGIGLIGVLGQAGVVQNIGVVNVTVTGDGFVGAVVGASYGIISNSYSTGNVTGVHYVGGLAGSIESYATVNNSYSTGNVTGVYYVGGLVGALGSSLGTLGGTVSDSYSIGIVTGNSSVGGLVGRNDYYGTASDSFWDTETSGQNISAGGVGKNTTEMQDVITFSGAAWNITAVALNETDPAYIWNIVSNVTYPFLSWEP